jgi:sensor histidine kinase regulating citrate/malate metabolism
MTINFRTRLLLGFLGLAVFASGLVFFLSAQHSREALRDQIRSTVLTIAVEAAAEVDVLAHESIRAAADEDGEAYRKVQAALREVRDRNRRDNINVAHLPPQRHH